LKNRIAIRIDLFDAPSAFGFPELSTRVRAAQTSGTSTNQWLGGTAPHFDLTKIQISTKFVVLKGTRSRSR
jgi:hypothetical protein